jgi:hypothetical protein
MINFKKKKKKFKSTDNTSQLIKFLNDISKDMLNVNCLKI